jgi:toxin ParE1/3/4
MRGFWLSPQAFQSLENIHIYSVENFGTRRAEVYVEDILARCRALAAGNVPHQACRALFADDIRADLRLVRAGSHVIIFTEEVREIRILDIIHQSADITRRLRTLE